LSSHDPDAERLNAAIDALLAGTAVEAACANLPPDLHAAAVAGARLAAVRAGASGGPRPAFVLALEEHLRTDLRLGHPNPPAEPPDDPQDFAAPHRAPPVVTRARVRRAVAGVVVAIGLLGLWRAAEIAGPTDALYPLKRAIESVRLLLAWSEEAKAGACLDLGWRRLQETGQVVRAGPHSESELREMLEDLTAAYTLALTYAEQSDDRRTMFLAQSETRLAYDEIRRLASQSGAPDAALLRGVNLVISDDDRGQRRIVAMTSPPSPVVVAPTQVAIAVPGTAEPPPAATATPVEGPPAEPTEPPAPGATPVSTAAIEPTATPPVATSAPASPTPVWPTVTAPPPTPIKPNKPPSTATATALPPPSQTPGPVPSDPPTRTPEAWSTATPAQPTVTPSGRETPPTPDPRSPAPPSLEPPGPRAP